MLINKYISANRTLSYMYVINIFFDMYRVQKNEVKIKNIYRSTLQNTVAINVANQK